MKYDYNLILNGYTICDNKWLLKKTNDFYFRIYYVYGGEAYCQYDNKTFQLKKGTLYLFPIRHPYTITHNPSDPLTVLWFHVDTPMLLCSHLISYNVKKDTTLGYLLEVLRTLSVPPLDQDVFDITFSAFFNLICNKPDIVSYKGERISRLLKYIEDNLQNGITVNHMSKFMGLERSYFSRKFKKIFYATPSQYIKGRKLNLGARELLQGASVSTASQKAGYEDEKAFSRAFKHQMGISPAKFRRTHNS